MKPTFAPPSRSAIRNVMCRRTIPLQEAPPGMSSIYNGSGIELSSPDGEAIGEAGALTFRHPAIQIAQVRHRDRGEGDGVKITVRTKLGGHGTTGAPRLFLGIPDGVPPALVRQQR